jgi:hypothetical protein
MPSRNSRELIADGASPTILSYGPNGAFVDSRKSRQSRPETPASPTAVLALGAFVDGLYTGDVTRKVAEAIQGGESQDWLTYTDPFQDPEETSSLTTWGGDEGHFDDAISFYTRQSEFHEYDRTGYTVDSLAADERTFDGASLGDEPNNLYCVDDRRNKKSFREPSRPPPELTLPYLRTFVEYEERPRHKTHQTDKSSHEERTSSSEEQLPPSSVKVQDSTETGKRAGWWPIARQSRKPEAHELSPSHTGKRDKPDKSDGRKPLFSPVSRWLFRKNQQSKWSPVSSTQHGEEIMVKKTSDFGDKSIEESQGLKSCTISEVHALAPEELEFYESGIETQFSDVAMVTSNQHDKNKKEIEMENCDLDVADDDIKEIEIENREDQCLITYKSSEMVGGARVNKMQTLIVTEELKLDESKIQKQFNIKGIVIENRGFDCADDNVKEIELENRGDKCLITCKRSEMAAPIEPEEEEEMDEKEVKEQLFTAKATNGKS